MKKVYIDNSRRLVVVNGKRVPRLLLGIVRGAIGKLFVVKHYRDGKIVVTKYPDMSGVVATEKQRVRRDLFREAVVYAKWILADEERKKAFKKNLPRRKQQRVYQAAIQLYMSRQGDKQWLRKQLAVKGMMRAQRTEVTLIGMQEGKRQLAMGIKWGSAQNEWPAERIVYGDEQQGQRHLIWEKKRDIGWKVVEHIRQQELPDCITDLEESDFDIGWYFGYNIPRFG